MYFFTDFAISFSDRVNRTFIITMLLKYIGAAYILVGCVSVLIRKLKGSKIIIFLGLLSLISVLNLFVQIGVSLFDDYGDHYFYLQISFLLLLFLSITDSIYNYQKQMSNRYIETFPFGI